MSNPLRDKEEEVICNDCKGNNSYMIVRGVSDLAGGDYYNGPEICNECARIRREKAIVEFESKKGHESEH